MLLFIILLLLFIYLLFRKKENVECLLTWFAQGQVAGFVLHIATSKRGVAEVANVGVLEEFRQMVRTHHVLQLL